MSRPAIGHIQIGVHELHVLSTFVITPSSINSANRIPVLDVLHACFHTNSGVRVVGWQGGSSLLFVYDSKE